MRQLVYTKTGSYDVLQVQEVPDLTPNKDELLIQVKASGLNFADILARKGQYPDGPKTPCVMGYEVSGIVTEVGSEIEKGWTGKEVIGLCRFKGQAEQVVLKEKQVYEKPASLSFEEAASIPVTYLTPKRRIRSHSQCRRWSWLSSIGYSQTHWRHNLRNSKRTQA